ncbi:natural killer cells antigen CD94-like isoform X2 [Cheilinus undulatus]|uniref:natural killer cells antigen CD94-like isoform X2 n=1 Tax=Cheilinus undulatus TaxID=241271 RepID=UPI001BD52EA5|nr:natural killer cells antigen CD94-like isoform X2 [Cheilinus undulatus]
MDSSSTGGAEANRNRRREQKRFTTSALKHFSSLLPINMAVVFSSRDSYINAEVGEYQELPRPEPKDATAEKDDKLNFRRFSVVLLIMGLLCVLQGILNIALRLALTQPAVKVETEEPSCPQGWVMFASSCYFISSQQRNWDNSRRDCLQRGADLVVINSRLEQAFLTGFTEAAWVGMTDREKEGTWVWVDGTLVDKDSCRFRGAAGHYRNIYTTHHVLWESTDSQLSVSVGIF